MSRRVLLALPLLLAGAGAVWATTGMKREAAGMPQRIVSTNLCTDQLLLALADRSQIAGLTPNAVDRGMSMEADAAKGLPLVGYSAERILAARPDLILGMPATGSPALAPLPPGPKLVDVRFANTLPDVYASIRETAAAVGHADRGEAMVARMERDLAGLGTPGRGRVAAYYQRRGYMTGTGTLVDDLMRRVGLVNLAGTLGKGALAQLSLEEMVAARPDFLIVEDATERVNDQGSEMLHHPALRDIPRIRVREAWTVCGGPAYADAARSMADQLARH